MPTYLYKATDSSGKIVNGSLEAEGEKGVVTELHDMGFIPIRIALSKGSGKRLDVDISKQISSFLKGVSSKDILAFTQDLSTLLESGLPVDRALSILIEAAEKEKVKEVVGDILKTVQGGGYLSDAMAKHPKVFSTFYVNMVKAGEAGGVLESVLGRLGAFLESSQELKDYIKSALVYPLFLVFVGGASIIILLTFVIPKFSVIFSDMGQEIPFTTRFLLDLSEVLRSYWWVILGGLGAIVFFLRRYFSTRAGRLRLDRNKLSFPVVGGLVRKIEVARFARTLGTLTKSGVPILQALVLVKDIIGNRVIAKSMEEVYDKVKEGDKLSKPLSDSGIFPSLAIQMITVGEETGRLDGMLLRVAENYEKMVKDTVKRFISLLEPAMILAMGLVVGFVVISMLMAIFSMNEMPF
ncbi:MAG: type II secretion system inner membrane protein GspF [Deltaproteobacteria bacterium]|nr:type II secretion system inner membrane protein GspF [Deltaproteobacteria bacterium]